MLHNWGALKARRENDNCHSIQLTPLAGCSVGRLPARPMTHWRQLTGAARLPAWIYYCHFWGARALAAPEATYLDACALGHLLRADCISDATGGQSERRHWQTNKAPFCLGRRALVSTRSQGADVCDCESK